MAAKNNTFLTQKSLSTAIFPKNPIFNPKVPMHSHSPKTSSLTQKTLLIQSDLCDLADLCDRGDLCFVPAGPDINTYFAEQHSR